MKREQNELSVGASSQTDRREELIPCRLYNVAVDDKTILRLAVDAFPNMSMTPDGVGISIEIVSSEKKN